MSGNGWSKYTVRGRPVGREATTVVNARNEEEARNIAEKRFAASMDSYGVEIIDAIKKE